jgi:hypothetical protein
LTEIEVLIEQIKNDIAQQGYDFKDLSLLDPTLGVNPSELIEKNSKNF